MLVLSWTFSILCMITLNSVSSKIIVEEDERNNSITEKSDTQKYFDLTVTVENEFKKIMKSAVKQIMPSMIHLNEVEEISDECISALLKYVKGLTQAKLWAVKMLDATSKLPPGVVIGTFADYGSFDECLAVEAPGSSSRNSGFRGSSCAVQVKPPMPPLPDKFTLVKTRMANDTDTLGEQFRVAFDAMHHKWFRLVACVPSKCSLQDMRHIAQKVSSMSGFTIKIPMCYVKEDIPLEPVHFAVLAAVALLTFLVILGTIADSQYAENCTSLPVPVKTFLIAFSFPTNLKRLLSPSGGSTELKCIHGIRAIGMCWIIIGHTYVLISFDLLKEPYIIKTWFASLSFQLLHNTWLSVETFFVLSGILVSYGGMKSLSKVNGKLNVPLLIIRRYVRLTPSVLLLMGVVFFLPHISSGPFWFEQVDPQLESCRNYWWSTLLYISNWIGIDKGCMLTTWYLSADFQLHIFSLIILVVIFRFAKIGLSLLVTCILLSCAAVGVETVIQNLSATMLLSAVDNQRVFEGLNHIHVYTMTHLGPHCIGMVLGYYIYKYREKKLSKWVVMAGWCASIALSLSAILGIHRFATGEETSDAMSILYASVHRCVYAIGVAWVAFACITGYGGPVNSLLSSSIFAPLSRLTFMVYLLHPLVIWTRLGSLRERPVATHYDFIYSFLANSMTSFALAVPFYLLLEAPLSNLDRMVFSGSKKKQDKEAPSKKQDNPLSSEKGDWNHISLPSQAEAPTIVKTRM